MSKINKVSLTREDFLKLVSGEVVEQKGINGETHIILQDIGWDQMDQCITEAMQKHGIKR